MTSPIDLADFAGWVPFAALPNANVPTEPGVYVVVRPSSETPTFLERSPAGHFKGRDPTVPVTDLERLWVPGEHLIYIGKANRGASGRRGLRKRLDEYRRFGAGEPAPHSGGRRIWQLADHSALLVGWKVTDDADAAGIESEMIAAFRAHHGVRPFANARN